MKNPFKKQEPPPPEQKEEEQIKLSDITDLNTITQIQFQDLMKRENTSQLSARLDTLKHHLKTMTFLPMETPEEKIKRKRKVNLFMSMLQTEITQRRNTQAKVQFESEKNWNKENIPRMLPNIRYTSGANVISLRKGMITLDIPVWQTPESTTIKIGHTEFDLMRMHPSIWKTMLQHKFTPMYFPITGTKTGAIRNGKELKHWRTGKETYTEAQKIKLTQPTYLAIMLV